ncbi:hexokinase-1-like isoform X2 [Mya arenaria]|uniref:hexokinase-1-like isoform X2 n=1 Tax=Mya arenaria TaxID=6604 RepID=UPI0022E2ABDC|nr:hexokinase-1-like isoform X2 [Mya arenaria]
MEPLTTRKRINSISSNVDHEKVVGVLSQLVYDDAAIRKFIETFEEQIRFANSTDEKLRKQTDLFWENTFVRRLFDGTESGTYLGIDLGGTNFRIVRVDMTNGEARTSTKYYNLEEKLLTASSAELFDYIALSLKQFLEKETFECNKVPLGFTFSFPSTQMSLRKSIITTWTKRIKCSDGPGLDSVILLEEAIERLGSLPVSIEVVGRISDTTGTLLAGNLLDHKCLAGLIIGTGSNAAYVEYTKNIEKWDACYKDDDPSEIVCINTEFGCLGDNGCLNFLRNDFVREVDEHSVHPGSFTFERNFSGLYLGELVRVALIRLANEGLLFKGQSLDKLSQRWAFSTKHVTDIERDTEEDNSNTLAALNDFGISNPTTDDILLVREVAELTSTRGAFIIATAMVVLLNHINQPEVTIAVDGSLYEHHPNYHNNMMAILSKWRPQTKTTLKLVKDGSGQGGALVAAIAQKSKAT